MDLTDEIELTTQVKNKKVLFLWNILKSVLVYQKLEERLKNIFL